MNVTTTLGERITDIRKQNKLTQTQFGHLFGVKHNLVSAWENDSRMPSSEVIKEMSERFGVSYYKLLTGNDDENYAVCEELGLANDTINTLKEWKKIDPSGAGKVYAQDVIDILVANPHMLYAIGAYLTKDFSQLYFFDYGEKKLLDALKELREDMKGAKSK